MDPINTLPLDLSIRTSHILLIQFNLTIAANSEHKNAHLNKGECNAVTEQERPLGPWKTLPANKLHKCDIHSDVKTLLGNIHLQNTALLSHA